MNSPCLPIPPCAGKHLFYDEVSILRSAILKSGFSFLTLGFIACKGSESVAAKQNATAKTLQLAAANCVFILSDPEHVCSNPLALVKSDPNFKLQSLTARDGELTFVWSEAKNAEAYTIFIGSSSLDMLPFSETKSTKVTIANLRNQTRYYFRIVARDANTQELGQVLTSGIPSQN